jgi:hypothetical protein
MVGDGGFEDTGTKVRLIDYVVAHSTVLPGWYRPRNTRDGALLVHAKCHMRYDYCTGYPQWY